MHLGPASLRVTTLIDGVGEPFLKKLISDKWKGMKLEQMETVS